MSTRKRFTAAEVEALRANPYTEKVSEDQISFTLAFKEAFWQLSVEGYTGNMAFRKLGYDPDVLGFERVHNITKRIRHAAHTPEGIRGSKKSRMRISRENWSNAEMEKMSRRESEQRLQNEIIYLQQQKAFLKKTYAAAGRHGTGFLTMERSSFKFGVIRDTLSEKSNVLTVTELCGIAGVSRSGYYTWLRAEKTRQEREIQDQADFQQILATYRFRGYDKGARGIHMRLLHTGVQMNVKKIRRLMKKFGLFCPIRKANPYRRMQKAIRTNNTADNLVNREFEEHGPRSVLLTDITYIPLNGAFCYLSTILDACTKQVLSHVLSESLEMDFVLETVRKLVEDHGVSLNKETIIHSDHGCHYTCIKFIQFVQNSDLRQSMSRKGNCWDNAPQESFFGHMKDELANAIPKWTCFADVQRSIADWIDYYNNDRYQWDLAKLSPNEYYRYLSTGEYPFAI